MRSREVVVPILNHEYKTVVLISNKPDYILRKLNDWGYETTKEYVNGALDNRRGVTFVHPRCHPVIAVYGCSTAEEIGTLAHEAFHAVDNIMNKIEETSYDEVVAHSIGAIVRSVLKQQNQSNKLEENNISIRTHFY